MRVVFLLGFLMLVGCGSGSGTPQNSNVVASKYPGGGNAQASQCSDIAVEANCKDASFTGIGCYWNAGVCASATACSHLTGETACKASTLTPNTAACVWVDLDGPGFQCQDPTVTTSTQCTDIKNAGDCAVSEFNNTSCLWDLSLNTCSAAVACSQFSSAINDNSVACGRTTINSNQCQWTPGNTAQCAKQNASRDYICAFGSDQTAADCACTKGTTYVCSPKPGNSGTASASCVFTPAATGGTCR